MSTPVLLTALYGGCDTLHQAPAGFESVCYTDDQRLRDDPRGWAVRLAAPPDDPRRAARTVRCQLAALFPERLVVWADASFAYLDLASAVADLGDAEMAGFAHPERDNCYDEAAVIVAVGQARAEVIAAQLDEYRRAGFAPTGLTAAGLLLFRPTPRVAAFLALWAEHIARYTVNEQISLDYCAWVSGLEIRRLRGTYIDNPYVRFDHKDHRRRRKPYRT